MSPEITLLPAISDDHRRYLRERNLYKNKVRLFRILLLIALIAAWEFSTHWGLVDSFIFSSPSRVFRTLLSLHNEGILYYHIWVTLYQTVVGFILGTIIGTVFAIILWWSELLAEILDPYLVVFNSLPKIALGPIIIVWFGAGALAIIVVALLISVIVTILSVYSGFAQVDPDKVRLLRTFGAGRLQILQKVILPASVPTIISALKINVGLSWVGVIVGEFLVSRAGLGYLIIYGGQVFRLDLVMTSVILLSVAAALMYQFVVYLGKILTP
jgi:NitT/TauT family transport system permease protein